MNNILTASRMVTMLQCPRQHYWRYEIGLQYEFTGLAQRIGSAWARGQEARWKGASFEKANAAALSANDLDELSASIVSALLAGYYARYKSDRSSFKIKPEEEFHFELGFGDFVVAGKLDGLGVRRPTNHGVLIEGKTTNDNIAPDAQYWMRLKFNMQVLQYFDAAQKKGLEIEEVIYDVTRKPQIRPKEIQEHDKKGLVVVRDSQGERVANSRNGEWKKTADKAKGEYIASHIETPAEFSDRLFNDTISRPEFYFARQPVHILESDLEMFRAQRLSIAHSIISQRGFQKGVEINGGRPESAWPRNVLDSTCSYCPFKSFCLQNYDIYINHPPQGFSVKPFNPELNYEHTTTAQDDSTAD